MLTCILRIGELYLWEFYSLCPILTSVFLYRAQGTPFNSETVGVTPAGLLKKSQVQDL